MKFNQYVEAFKESANILAMSTCLMMSAALGDARVLLVGGVLETFYLLVVADSKFYQQRLRQRSDAIKEAEFRAEFQKVFDNASNYLSDGTHKRYRRLCDIREQVARATADQDTWYNDVLRKLDQMLMAFLNFGAREAQFRVNLYHSAKSLESQKRNAKQATYCPVDATVEEVEEWAVETAAHITSSYAAEIQDIESKIQQAGTADMGYVSILQKRSELIKRRREYTDKMSKMLVNMHHQMMLLEDTFGLIADEAQSRPPQQVINDIDEVVFQSNLLTSAIDEFDSNSQVLTTGA